MVQKVKYLGPSRGPKSINVHILFSRLPKLWCLTFWPALSEPHLPALTLTPSLTLLLNTSKRDWSTSNGRYPKKERILWEFSPNVGPPPPNLGKNPVVFLDGVTKAGFFENLRLFFGVILRCFKGHFSLGKFTKVLGIEPPPPFGKNSQKITFFWTASLSHLNQLINKYVIVINWSKSIPSW